MAIYRHMRHVFVGLLLLISLVSSAQDVFINHFRSSDGLDTDIVKCVAQDPLGFIWIGTDDGLFRYDGIRFMRCPLAAPSKFFKDFLITKDQRLLAVHDLGITEIVSSIDTVQFRPLLPGGRIRTDSTLWYPKHAYEDTHGNIWIAEPQSVVRYFNGSWKRYLFGPECSTTSFVRSFNFYQISSEELLVVSNTGIFFVYNYTSGSISRRATRGASEVIYEIKKIGNDIFAGTEAGLSRLELSDPISLERVQLEHVDASFSIRHLLSLGENKFLVCGTGKNTAIVTREGDQYLASPVVKTDMLVNQAFQSADGAVWLSTEKGVVILTNPEFDKLPIDSPNNYIEAIKTREQDSTLMVLTKGQIWSLHKKTLAYEPVLTELKGYFLSGDYGDGAFIASSGQELLKIADGKVVRRLDLSAHGRFVFDVFADGKGTLWVTQEASIGVKGLDPASMEYVVYGAGQGLPVEASEIARSDSGIFVIASDPDHYLFHKNTNDSLFTAHSLRFAEPYRRGLSIECLAAKGNTLWLGTNFGVFRQENGRLEKFNINSVFDESATRMLAVDEDFLWIANTAGLIRYDLKSGDYAHFTENSGLPVNTINHECLVLDQGKVWVGTSQGIAVATAGRSADFLRTPKPYILDFKINGTSMPIDSQQVIELGHLPFVEIAFSSLSFPANDIQYSYRLNDQPWSSPQTNPEVSLSSLKEGMYVFEVKAKRRGNFSWSPAQSAAFRVAPPFYRSVAFYLLLLGVMGVAVIGTRHITKAIEKNRQRELKRLVSEQTRELSDIKESLETIVQMRTAELEMTVEQLKEAQNQLVQIEKMASLGVLTAGIAHEINNPVNYLKGGIYSLDKLLDKHGYHGTDEERSEQLKEVMRYMRLGLDRITNIVNGLSRYSRKGNADMAPCNIHDIISNCLLILDHEFRSKCETKIALNAESFAILGDEGTLHQLFVNILSNAAQAMEEYGEIRISTQNVNDKIEIQIQDTGSGIAPKVMDKLFDPFFTTKAPGQGTGLGLYIAKRIVSEHQASIDFDSRIGEGTTVFIRFRVIQPDTD